MDRKHLGLQLILVAVLSQGQSATCEDQLKKLGNIDGKTYFVNSNKMAWDQVHNFCDENGLEFGTIETAAQSQLIYDGIVKELDSGERAWINAREKEVKIPIAWASGELLEEGMFAGGLVHYMMGGEVEEELYCGAVSEGSDGLFATCYECSELHHVLCHLIE